MFVCFASLFFAQISPQKSLTRDHWARFSSSPQVGKKKYLKMHQIDALKYGIFIFFLWGSMHPDPLRGVISFSPFSPLTRFHAWTILLPCCNKNRLEREWKRKEAQTWTPWRRKWRGPLLRESASFKATPPVTFLRSSQLYSISALWVQILHGVNIYIYIYI